MLIVLKKPPLCLNELCPLLIMTRLLNLAMEDLAMEDLQMATEGLAMACRWWLTCRVYKSEPMLTLYHIYTWEFTNAYCIEGTTALPKRAVPAADSHVHVTIHFPAAGM